MRIAILGSGYVGLVSGASFAELGHTVTCVDVDDSKIARLRRGEMTIFEPGLEEMVARNAAAGRLDFSTEIAGPVGDADVVFIAVGTPARQGDGQADLSFVYAAADAIGRAMRGFTVVVTKSTVPLGTGDEIERIIAKANPLARFAVASNPEFLREGVAIRDFMHPDRVVIGTADERARAVLAGVYQPLAEAPLVFVSRRTAELIKYAGNAFLALKLTFINEIADLCEATGVDVREVSNGIGMDRRIGAMFLNAGPGYGGSCFPKDTMALMKTARDYGVALSLVETTSSINDNRKRAMARKVIAACGGGVRDKKVAVLGLTFKPDTDDVREAPALSIIRALQDYGATVSAYDPKGMEATAALVGGVEFCADAYAAAQDAAAVVIATEWSEFHALDFDALGTLMKERVVVDLRNMFETDEMARRQFRYASVGRPEVVPELEIRQAAE